MRWLRTRPWGLAVGLVVGILLIDQVVKVYIKTHFVLGEELCVFGEWFRLHFVENNGMAFGMELWGAVWGKLLLTAFRLAACAVITWFLWRITREQGTGNKEQGTRNGEQGTVSGESGTGSKEQGAESKEQGTFPSAPTPDSLHPVSLGLVVCVALVLAGAIGNIFDSVFYGVLFSSSWGQVAEFLPPDGGYSTWLQGRVVDMLYFPLIEGDFPGWLPVWGGEHFLFFRPVFNVADASISVGIIALILFERESLSSALGGGRREEEEAKAETE